jgi:hypothetical protein
MFAAEDLSPITIPSWIERVALPKYPHMEIVGYVLLAIGFLFLVIGYFAPIKKLPSLLAALSLLAYYPLAYLAHWFLFRFNEETRFQSEPSRFEDFLFNHTRAMDWTILGVCAFFGFIYSVWTVWGTIRKYRRLSPQTKVSADNPFADKPVAQPVARPQPAAARPTAPRPAAAPPAQPVRKVVKRPPAPPPSDNPFDFTS